MVARILLIDDDESDRELLGSWLDRKGHTVDGIPSAEMALERLSQSDHRSYNLVLLDYRLPGMRGTELLQELKTRLQLTMPVILITGHGGSEVAIPAYKLGAFDYFPKPLDLSDPFLDELLWPKIQKAIILDKHLKTCSSYGQSNAKKQWEATELIGGKSMWPVYEAMGYAARSHQPVLIIGEAGTGKDLVARALLRHSDRADKPFLKVDCCQFHNPHDLEAELYGSAASAEQCPRTGALVKAGRGAVYLDRISCIESPCAQAKLFQAIEERTIRPCSADQSLPIESWILASAQEDFRFMVEEGGFHRALYHRFTMIHLPPLRERRDDIKLLADAFLAQIAREENLSVCSFQEQAWTKLCDHSWPGNIWELREVIRKAALAARGPQITEPDLRLENGSHASELTMAAHIRQAIRLAAKSRHFSSPLLKQLLDRDLIQSAWSQAGEIPDEVTALLSAFEPGLRSPDLSNPTRISSGNGRKLAPSRRKAYQLYQWAIEQSPELAEGTDADVFLWLQNKLKNSTLVEERDALPAKFDTFSKYLREARAAHDDHKSTPLRSKVPGKSIVSSEQI